MTSRVSNGGVLLTVGALLLALAGCGNPSGPSALPGSVAGAWTGPAQLPDGATTSMSLQQVGSSVTGIMSLTGGFHDKALTGTFVSASRLFTWNTGNGCEAWSGQLTLTPDGQQMAGTIKLDASGCGPTGRDASGTLTLNR